MKVIIAWGRDKYPKTAKEVLRTIELIESIYSRRENKPERTELAEDILSQQYVEYRVESFRNCQSFCEEMIKQLALDHGIRAFIGVQPVEGVGYMSLAGYTSYIEENENRFRAGINTAIAELKKSRNKIKNYLFQGIRTSLENCLIGR